MNVGYVKIDFIGEITINNNNYGSVDILNCLDPAQT